MARRLERGEVRLYRFARPDKQWPNYEGMINVAVNCAGILGAGRVLGREAPMPLDAPVIRIDCGFALIAVLPLKGWY